MDNEMENITSDINFSEEQIEQLYAGFVKRFRLEEQARDEQREGANLPQEIFEEMEYSSKNDLAFNLKKVARDVRKYEGGEWTTPETINKSIIPDLKRYNIDTLQVITTKYKDADRLRLAGHGVTEIYEALKMAAERGGDPSDEDIIMECIEKLRRLAVYNYATAKQMDLEAKSMATKALRLPDSIKHITEDEDHDKKLAFDPELIERINKAKYDDAILRAATRRTNNFNSGNSSNFNGKQQGQGRPFFGHNRPQNQHLRHNRNNRNYNNSSNSSSNNNTNSNNNPNNNNSNVQKP
jgi:hypothetical protein